MRISRWETFENFHCPNCQQAIESYVSDYQKPSQKEKNSDTNSQHQLKHCLICGNTNLFRQKLFNRNWGIAIVVIGIVISLFVKMKVLPLLIVAAIDLCLYLFLPFMGVCYACDSEHRGFKDAKSLEAYDHLKAAKVKNEVIYPGAEENH